jgi:uncharacterized SAM-binding protein YcdF (DUF218 family)
MAASGLRAPSRLASVAGALGLAAFFAIAYTPLTTALEPAAPPAPVTAPADAIVVLGAGMSKDGVLSDSSLDRLVSGIVLYRRGLAPRLMLLGPGNGPGPAEADVRAALARDLGVPAESILTEARGLTTRQEAALTAARMRETGGKRVLLVTGTHHMLRSRLLFAREGLEVVPAPVVELSPVAEQPEARLDLARLRLQEALARVYYRLAGFL